jgi:hypothetical protein
MPIGVKLLSVLALSAVGAFAVLSFAPKSAYAVEREHHIGLDTGLSMLKVGDKSTLSVGAGAGAHYSYGITDQFNFMAEGAFSLVAIGEDKGKDIPKTRPASVSHASAGIAYVFDVLSWVPYAGILVGGYYMAGGSLDGGKVLGGAQLIVGLDYRITRKFSLGLALHQHVIFTDASTYPSYSNGFLRAEYVWGW